MVNMLHLAVVYCLQLRCITQMFNPDGQVTHMHIMLPLQVIATFVNPAKTAERRTFTPQPPSAGFGGAAAAGRGAPGMGGRVFLAQGAAGRGAGQQQSFTAGRGGACSGFC